jgi:hypothetical protein
MNVHDEKYLDSDLARWAEFLSRYDDESVHIFDAAPFQNSIRYSLECGNENRINKYIDQFQSLLEPHEASVIYLRPKSVNTQIDYCLSTKGESWVKNVPEYIENVPHSKERERVGIEGMKAFWNDYAQLCDGVMERISIPSKIIRFVPGEWARVNREAVGFLERPLA